MTITKAIIGGTGTYDMGKHSTKIMETKYGQAKVYILEDKGIAFLPRHGIKHESPPHRINYHANLLGLKELGVQYILSMVTVGSCHEDYPPGSLALVDDFLDFTSGRPKTFFDDRAYHISMENPYCPSLNESIVATATRNNIPLKGPAIYVATEGPRFETKAEIRMYNKLGGHLVGMTGVPEVPLANELGFCYSAVAIVTNWGTGMGENLINLEDMQDIRTHQRDRLVQIFLDVFIQNKLSLKKCNCHDAFISKHGG